MPVVLPPRGLLPLHIQRLADSRHIKQASGEALNAKGRQRVPGGERLVLAMPGGGGYGSVAQRDPQAVFEDVRNGMVSRDAAINDYGLDADQF